MHILCRETERERERARERERERETEREGWKFHVALSSWLEKFPDGCLAASNGYMGFSEAKAFNFKDVGFFSMFRVPGLV